MLLGVPRPCRQRGAGAASEVAGAASEDAGTSWSRTSATRRHVSSPKCNLRRMSSAAFAVSRFVQHSGNRPPRRSTRREGLREGCAVSTRDIQEETG